MIEITPLSMGVLFSREINYTSLLAYESSSSYSQRNSFETHTVGGLIEPFMFGKNITVLKGLDCSQAKGYIQLKEETEKNLQSPFIMDLTFTISASSFAPGFDFSFNY